MEVGSQIDRKTLSYTHSVAPYSFISLHKNGSRVRVSLCRYPRNLQVGAWSPLSPNSAKNLSKNSPILYCQFFIGSWLIGNHSLKGSSYLPAFTTIPFTAGPSGVWVRSRTIEAFSVLEALEDLEEPPEIRFRVL